MNRGTCLLCFAVNIETFNIKDTHLLYCKEIIDFKVEAQTHPHSLCYICHTKFQQCYTFLTQTRNIQMSYNDENVQDTSEGHNSQQDSQDLPEIPTENITLKANKRPRINKKDKILTEALNIMKNISGRQNATKENDEDGLFGDYIASQLRKIDRSTKAIVKHRINNIIFEAETGCRADMFSDFTKPSSAHSHPGYLTTAATPPSNYSTPTADTLPTNYSIPVYSDQPNANSRPVPPLETLDGEDAAPNRCNRSSQDIENILTSFE